MKDREQAEQAVRLQEERVKGGGREEGGDDDDVDRDPMSEGERGSAAESIRGAGAREGGSAGNQGGTQRERKEADVAGRSDFTGGKIKEYQVECA